VIQPAAGLPIRDELRGRSPYGAPQLAAPVRLNTNENPYPLPPAVVADLTAAIAAALRAANRYPDRDAIELRSALAGYLAHDLDVAQVWAANGSNEIQQQLLQVFGGPGRTALGFAPAYSMHPVLAAGTGTAWLDGRRDNDFDLSASSIVGQIKEHQPNVVLICAPNNPTGTALAPDVLTAALETAPGMVIVDEAYAEFARPGTASALSLLPRWPYLVVTRTMSKAFALAGVRIGYLAAAPAVVDAVQLVRLPYHLSALTQAAGVAAVRHRDVLLAAVEQIKAQRDRIVVTLSGWGIPVAPSDANFVLFGAPDPPRLWQALLDRGVLVRDVGLPGWLRVTAGTPAETDAFLAAMDEVGRLIR
jgi:histidinol-phosphate aminotransferase